MEELEEIKKCVIITKIYIKRFIGKTKKPK